MGEIKDKVEGKAHEVKGSATGDAGEELKGKAQQVKGNVEGAMNNAGTNARPVDRAEGDMSNTRANP
ncbi:MAG: CsbD family protein [Chloroflexota bacterium]